MSNSAGEHGSRWRTGLALLLAVLPWLNPFARGPSPAVVPWLVSAVCGTALWSLAVVGPARPALPRGLLAGATALVAWAMLSHLPLRPEGVMLAGGLALIVLSAGTARDAGIARALQGGFLAAAAASAAMGLVQYFGLSPLFGSWINATETGEAYANLRQPNQYATLCWIGSATVLFGTLGLSRRAGTALLALLAAGSAASVSRTGLLQGLVLTCLAALWAVPQRRERLRLCVVAAVAYFAATVLLPVLLDAWTGAMPARTLWGRLGGGQACSSRLVLWSNVLHLIAQKPLTGWGWGELDYAHYLTLYPGERFCDILDNAHNLPLHLAVELGVPAALLAGAAVLVFVLRRRPWREGLPRRQLAWAVLALIGLHSLLEYPLWYGPFQIAFGVAVGWLRMPGDEQELAPPVRRGIVVACLLLAATGYAAWDYARVSQIYMAPDQRLPPWREDTLAHVRRSWLFSGQAGFADVTLASVDRTNAQAMQQLAGRALHYSPEPRVIERLIESETMLGRTDEAVLDLARYRAAFPKEYAAWRDAQKQPLRLP